MGRLKGLLDTFNSLTGRSGRHNKALRDVTEWLATIQEFFTEYNLQEEGSNLDSILENIGEAKFKLINIKYRAREIIKTAPNIKGFKISPLINEIVDEFDGVRRALINLDFDPTMLIKVIPELHNSFKKLQDAISEIEYK